MQIISSETPSADERREWWQAFYGGAAFSTFARFLLVGTFLSSIEVFSNICVSVCVCV